jgi:hypothetical protein
MLNLVVSDHLRGRALGMRPQLRSRATRRRSSADVRAVQGRDVLLVDSDKHQSAATWAAARTKDSIESRITCVCLLGETLADRVRAMVPKYNDIISSGGADAPSCPAQCSSPTA